MKVLVVDDDVVSRMVLMHLVDSCGSYDIAEAADGQDAWDQLEAGLQPQVVFCDLRMPRLSGMDLLARVRTSAFPDLPFILVTSSTDTGTLDHAAELGASGLIVKPFQAGQVRVHLVAFSSPPAGWVHRAEPPAATVARLGIDARRLLAYLGGFRSQLTAASGEIDAMLARGEQDAAGERIARLHKGCLTLGLAGAADGFARLGEAAHQGDRIHLVLAEAVHGVMVQAEHTRTLISAY